MGGAVVAKLHGYWYTGLQESFLSSLHDHILSVYINIITYLCGYSIMQKFWLANPAHAEAHIQ